MTDSILHILLADDNSNEHVFFKHALKYVNESIKLSSAKSGQDLLSHLRNHSNQLPDILFLDINMPVKSGKECLKEIRENERYKNLSIVMYSTSDEPNDTDDTYALGADLYVRKPAEIEELISLLRSVIELFMIDGIQQTSRDRYVLSQRDKM
jgi:DNA-binding response OmpR family regulator